MRSKSTSSDSLENFQSFSSFCCALRSVAGLQTIASSFFIYFWSSCHIADWKWQSVYPVFFGIFQFFLLLQLIFSPLLKKFSLYSFFFLASCILTIVLSTSLALGGTFAVLFSVFFQLLLVFDPWLINQSSWLCIVTILSFIICFLYFAYSQSSFDFVIPLYVSGLPRGLTTSCSSLLGFLLILGWKVHSESNSDSHFCLLMF